MASFWSQGSSQLTQPLVTGPIGRKTGGTDVVLSKPKHPLPPSADTCRSSPASDPDRYVFEVTQPSVNEPALKRSTQTDDFDDLFASPSLMQPTRGGDEKQPGSCKGEEDLNDSQADTQVLSAPQPGSCKGEEDLSDSQADTQVLSANSDELPDSQAKTQPSTQTKYGDPNDSIDLFEDDLKLTYEEDDHKKTESCGSSLNTPSTSDVSGVGRRLASDNELFHQVKGSNLSRGESFPASPIGLDYKKSPTQSNSSFPTDDSLPSGASKSQVDEEEDKLIPLTFTSNGDLKAKLRSKSLIPPMTQMTQSGDAASPAVAVVFEYEDSQVQVITKKRQVDESEKVEKMVFDPAPVPPPSKKQQTAAAIRSSQNDDKEESGAAFNSYLCINMPNFSSNPKAPRVGLSKLDKVQPLHYRYTRK